MRTGCRTRRRPPERVLGAGSVAVAFLLLVSSGGLGPRGTGDARPRYEPAPPPPPVPESAVPPTVEADPLWSAPFSAEPKATESGFVGPVMPKEGETALRFLGVTENGVTRWSAPRNPSCTAFAVTRAGGRELAVLLDNSADRDPLTGRTTATAYDPRDGRTVWGPVEVPGTLAGPGLVFAEITTTIVSDESGPKIALSAATGEVVADETAGVRILHEHNGVLLVRAGERLRATDTGTGEELWNSDDLEVPATVARAAERVTVSYGAPPQVGSGHVIALRWRSSDDTGERYTHTVNDIRTGALLAELPTEREPRIVGGSGGIVAVAGGKTTADGTRTVLGVIEDRVLWRRRHDASMTLERVVDGVVYLSGKRGTSAIDARTGEVVGRGSWPVPVAALSGGTALVPVDTDGTRGAGETFVAMRGRDGVP